MKKIVTLILVVGFAFVLVGCQKKEESPTIKIGFLPSSVSIPFLYALEEGFYEEYGIDVEITFHPSGNARDQVLMGNGLNAVSTDLIGLILNNENNMNLKFTVTTEEIFRLVSSPDSNIENINQINNSKVAISELTVIEYLIDQVATDTITFNKVNVPPVPNRYKALMRATDLDQTIPNDIVLAIMPEPFSTRIVLNGGSDIWNNTQSNEPFYPTVIGFKESFINAHPDVVKKFHQATNDAINELKTKTFADYKDYYVKHNIIPEEYIDDVHNQLETLFTFNNLYQPDEDLFNDVITWLKSKETLSDYDFDYQYEDLYYNPLDE